MMERICVYAGSFDPVTLGHEDIIRRAAKLCDRLIVTVMYNPAKKGCFSVADRVSMLTKVTQVLPNVTVDAWDGLMVDYVRRCGASFVVRGVRGISDLEGESALAQINERLLPGLETVILLTRPELSCISSSAVRDAARFGADYARFVPTCILSDLQAHFDPQKEEQ